jgi:hypothetical protein
MVAGITMVWKPPTVKTEKGGPTILERLEKLPTSLA